MALYGKIKEEGGRRLCSAIRPVFNLRLLELESSAYLVSRKTSNIFFSIQAHNRNVLYLLTWARTNVVQDQKNSLLFRRVVQQPLHNIHNCSYLRGMRESWPGENKRVEAPLSLQSWCWGRHWWTHFSFPWAASPALKSHLESSWVREEPSRKRQFLCLWKGSQQAYSLTCLCSRAGSQRCWL